MHYFVRNWGAYDVYKLMDVVQYHPTRFLELNQFELALSYECWDGVDENGDQFVFSPNDLLGYKVYDQDHWERVVNADMYYPIIALDQYTGPSFLTEPRTIDDLLAKVEGRYDVLDGMHRLSKAKMMGMSHIPVKVVTWDEIQIAKINNLNQFIMKFLLGSVVRSGDGFKSVALE